MATQFPDDAHAWLRHPHAPTSGATRPRHGPQAVDAAALLAARLEAVAVAPSILDAIRAGAAIRTEVEAAGTADPSTGPRLAEVLAPATRDRSDGLTAVAATHGLALIPGLASIDPLLELLVDHASPLAANAAWRLADRPPAVALVAPLARLVGAGGLAGMHAQHALERWAHREPAALVAALADASRRAGSLEARARLTETLGLVPGEAARARLMAIADDPGEDDVVRATAVAALGDRWTEPLPPIVATLARGGGPLADTARLAAFDHEAGATFAAAGMSRPTSGLAHGRGIDPGAQGLRVAQVHLGGVMDADLRHSGAGDTGGIATLLVSLGDALLRTPDVGAVTTIGRGSAHDALPIAAAPTDVHHRYLPVPLRPAEGSAFTSPWPARVAARRGIRRAFLALGRPDVVHLRMADAGTLAAAAEAARRSIPTAFTLAPDPHARIAALESSGDLDRGSFLTHDAAQHLWYRVALVDRLARSADEVVLFPRQGLADRLRSLVGFDVRRESHRATVVAEGIDVGRAIDADAAARRGAPVTAGSALADLLERIDRCPPSRLGLPLVVSAGRLNEIKGMARLVEAFAGAPDLAARATLVIAGGDLAAPSTDERAELDRIAGILDRHPAAAHAVILLGHRPNAEVAAVLATARHGRDDRIAPNGAYVCASHKEEFGLAIVEALAAGLPVVAPTEGGPRTYVEDGRTGVLVDTGDTDALATGIRRVLALAGEPGRAERASASIRERYDIAAMAGSLAAVYRRAAEPRPERLAS